MSPQPISDAPEGGRGSPQLQSLLERVKAATGGDRELDARLHAAAFPNEAGMIHPGSPSGLRGSSHGPISDIDWTAWDHLSLSRGGDLGMVADHHSWPGYTTSLDAALGLCERVLPGHVWALSSGHLVGGPTGYDGYGADVAEFLQTPEYPEHFGRSPALALLAAMLEALSAQAADTTDAGHA